LKFGDILPGFKVQAKGEKKIDPYVTDGTIDKLPDAIQRYVDENPR